MKFGLAQVPVTIPNFSNNPLKNKAEKIEINYDQDQIIYKHPSFLLTNAEIVADKAIFIISSNRLILEGNVIYNSSTTLVNAKKATVEVVSQDVAFESATYYDPIRLIFAKAERIDKVGNDHFTMINASLSQCIPEDKAWEINSDYIDIQIENIVQAENLKLSVYHRTMFYFPYIAFPATTQRKSGFLLPTMAYSPVNQGDGYGFLIQTPYFWAISPSDDLTFSPLLATGRGTGFALEYNYAFLPNQVGQFSLFEIKENLQKRYTNFENLVKPIDDAHPLRWHSQYFNNNWGADYSIYAQAESNSDYEIFHDYLPFPANYYYEHNAAAQLDFALDEGYGLFGVEDSQTFFYNSRYDKMTDPAHIFSSPHIYWEKNWDFAPSRYLSIKATSNYDDFHRPTVKGLDLSDASYAIYQRNEGGRLQASLGVNYILPLKYTKLTANFTHYANQYYDKKSPDYLSDSQNSGQNSGYEYNQTFLELGTDLYRSVRLATASYRVIHLNPFLNYTGRSDVDQRAGLYLPAGQHWQRNQNDYTFSNTKYDTLDIIPLRRSSSTGLRVSSDRDSSNGINFREFESSLSYTYDFLYDALKAHKIFKAPLLDTSTHPTNWESPWLPLELKSTFYLSPQLTLNNYIRYVSQDHSIAEKDFSISYLQNDMDQFAIGYNNISNSYQDLDGNYFPASDTISVQKTHPISAYWRIDFMADWNFLRTHYNQYWANKQLPQLMTDMNLTFTYLNCCYQLAFGYTENIQLQNLPVSGTQEVRDRSIFVSLNWLTKSYQTFSFH